MAVKASASVTLMAVVDVASTKRYYRLQSSTATVPTKPTANPPSGWQTTEPSYQEGSTMSLYTTDQTIFSDGTFSYSDVSLSSSYEASKVAYNKAVAAAAAAADALGKLLFGTSATASSTVAKVVNGVTGFTLANGVSVAVTFTNANLAAAPTLNVNGSGAKPIILYGGTNIFWEAKGTVVFVYNGTSWVCNSTPVYASESTIGDPANSNVHIGKDSSGASTIDFRQAATIVAQMQANKISLGMNSVSAVIRFCAGKLDMGYNSTNGGYSYISAPGSITVQSKNGGAVSLGIEKNGIMTDWGVGVNSSGIARVVGAKVQLDGELAVNGVAFAPLAADSGWKWLKGPYGTDKQGVKYRLKGGVVYIVADLGGDSNITVTYDGVSLGTLPEGYRPTSTILSACTGKSNNLGQFRITSAGVVTAWLFGNNSAYFASSLMYPVG